jgi:hypothetical protein
MRYALEIITDGAAFDGRTTSELARILRAEADGIAAEGVEAHRLRDINGNRCGGVTVDHTDDAEDPRDRMRRLGGDEREG